MDALKDLLTELGLPPITVAIIIIVVAILIFFIVRFLNSRAQQASERRSRLEQYLREQEQALLEAYRLLYERKDLRTLSEKEFLDIISEADEKILDPFTRYRAELPAEVQKKVYDDVHSVLAQFMPSPDMPNDIKPEARENLIRYEERFYSEIELTKSAIRRHL